MPGIVDSPIQEFRFFEDLAVFEEDDPIATARQAALPGRRPSGIASSRKGDVPMGRGWGSHESAFVTTL